MQSGSATLEIRQLPGRLCLDGVPVVAAVVHQRHSLSARIGPVLSFASCLWWLEGCAWIWSVSTLWFWQLPPEMDLGLSRRYLYLVDESNGHHKRALPPQFTGILCKRLAKTDDDMCL